MKNKRLLQRMRVPLGFVFAAVFLYFAHPEFATLIGGGVVALLGVLIRAWASGHIRKNQNLAISGPYAYTRNPLYLGSFILGVGFTVASGVWWLALLFTALFLGIYLPVMRVEAGDLIELFGEDYKEYASRVPLFFPQLSSYKASAEKFDMSLYMRYREYRAAVGMVFALSILAVKAFFHI